MNKLALLAATLFTLVSARSAEALSLFYYDYGFEFTATGSTTITAKGLFDLNSIGPSNPLTSASGIVDGDPITGFTVGSFFPTVLIFPHAPFSLGFTTSTGGATFTGTTSFSGIVPVNAQETTFPGGISTVTYGTLYVAPVPLPASAPLFGLALLGLAAFGFLRSRNRSRDDVHSMA
jgi:hypothetical protein